MEGKDHMMEKMPLEQTLDMVLLEDQGSGVNREGLVVQALYKEASMVPTQDKEALVAQTQLILVTELQAAILVEKLP